MVYRFLRLVGYITVMKTEQVLYRGNYVAAATL